SRQAGGQAGTGSGRYGGDHTQLSASARQLRDPGPTRPRRRRSCAPGRAGNPRRPVRRSRPYRGDLPLADPLAKADPGNAGWQRDLSVSYSMLAGAYWKAGEKPRALDALRNGRAIMVRLTTLSPDNAVWKSDLAWFDGKIAELGR